MYIAMFTDDPSHVGPSQLPIDSVQTNSTAVYTSKQLHDTGHSLCQNQWVGFALYLLFAQVIRRDRAPSKSFLILFIGGTRHINLLLNIFRSKSYSGPFYRLIYLFLFPCISIRCSGVSSRVVHWILPKIQALKVFFEKIQGLCLSGGYNIALISISSLSPLYQTASTLYLYFYCGSALVAPRVWTQPRALITTL